LLYTLESRTELKKTHFISLEVLLFSHSSLPPQMQNDYWILASWPS